MTLKFSEFGEYDPTLPITDTQGVGLQSEINVRFPAWYFSSNETLISGASPVFINPEVYHTQIVSGGTGGIEIVKFPDVDPRFGGMPHLVTLVTHTNPADVIHIQGISPITGMPFSGAVIPSDNRLFRPTLLSMNSVDQGYVLTWTDYAWAIQQLVNEPVVTYPFASQQQWGGYNAPATLYQDVDGTYNLSMDPTNPQFHVTVTASPNIGSPTVVPGGVRFVTVNSTGLGGPGYIRFEGPAVNPHDIGATGITKTVEGNLINGADTILCTNGSIRNFGNTNFTTFDLNDNMATMYWDNVWIAMEPTNCITDPDVIVPIMGARYRYAIARNGGTYTVTRSQNYASFCNFGGSETYNLPTGTQTGNVYTFTCLDLFSTITVVFPATTSVAVGGVSYASPTFSSSEYGATITTRDVASSGYVIESISGAWSIT